MVAQASVPCRAVYGLEANAATQYDCLSERVSESLNVGSICRGDQFSNSIIVVCSVVFPTGLIKPRQSKRNTQPLANVTKIAFEVLESANEIQDLAVVVQQERFLSLESPIATPMNVIRKRSQLQYFLVVRV